MKEDYILEMKHITKRFGNFTALEDMNISVKRGEIHAICGENGAGKIDSHEGSPWLLPLWYIRGRDPHGWTALCSANTTDSQRAGIAMVYQEINCLGIADGLGEYFLLKDDVQQTGGLWITRQCIRNVRRCFRLSVWTLTRGRLWEN